MAPSLRRRLMMMDILILVGAAGVGFAGYREYLRTINVSIGWVVWARMPPGGWTVRAVADRAWSLLALLAAPAAAWTLLLPILRSRPPRPRWRRCLRQPGMVACLSAWLAAAAVGSASGLAWLASRAPSGRPAPWGRWVNSFDDLFWRQPGLAIASAWLALALARRWRPEPDWIDRLGRALGVYWIAFGLLSDVIWYRPLL